MRLPTSKRRHRTHLTRATLRRHPERTRQPQQRLLHLVALSSPAGRGGTLSLGARVESAATLTPSLTAQTGYEATTRTLEDIKNTEARQRKSRPCDTVRRTVTDAPLRRWAPGPTLGVHFVNSVGPQPPGVILRPKHTRERGHQARPRLSLSIRTDKPAPRFVVLIIRFQHTSLQRLAESHWDPVYRLRSGASVIVLLLTRS